MSKGFNPKESMTCCPIEHTLSIIGKKWCINLVRDLYFGKKRFKEFLESNTELSSKVLSERLKDLEKQKIIEKNIVNTSPIIIEYKLTQKGLGLNRILYELSKFSAYDCLTKNTPRNKKAVNEFMKKTFKI